jgi:phosphoribosylanthranilate isomerase
MLERVQVKICGLTDEEQAVACAEMGADAVGLVFFSRSPRHVSDEQARRICRSLPSEVCTVGVFVNESYETVLGRVEYCGLRGVQLHGDESPEMVQLLREKGLVVLKTFFTNGHPSLDLMDGYPATASLVEAAGGALPGGNARTWDWSVTRGLSRKIPMVLAGGLNPGNVKEAIELARPDGVDVSSGVEALPGTKDLQKVRSFLARVRKIRLAETRVRQVFR